MMYLRSGLPHAVDAIVFGCNFAVKKDFPSAADLPFGASTEASEPITKSGGHPAEIPAPAPETHSAPGQSQDEYCALDARDPEPQEDKPFPSSDDFDSTVQCDDYAQPDRDCHAWEPPTVSAGSSALHDAIGNELDETERRANDSSLLDETVEACSDSMHTRHDLSGSKPNWSLDLNRSPPDWSRGCAVPQPDNDSSCSGSAHCSPCLEVPPLRLALATSPGGLPISLTISETPNELLRTCDTSCHASSSSGLPSWATEPVQLSLAPPLGASPVGSALPPSGLSEPMHDHHTRLVSLDVDLQPPSPGMTDGTQPYAMRPEATGEQITFQCLT
eukprot:scaffold64118_cov30-Prasinocladus_malaysianus.AAC.1